MSAPSLPSRALLLASVATLALTTPALTNQAWAQYAGGSSNIQLGPVTVQGQGQGQDQAPAGEYKVDQPGISKLTEPLTDTPQTITAVPRQLLDDQGNSTLKDALRNVPGVSLAAGEFGAQGDNLTIRGFTARSDIFLDGIRDFGSYYRDPFFLEDVQVLQGPSGILFGRGSTGGVVEQDSKQAQLKPLTIGTAAIGTDMTKRLTLDYDRPLTSLGDGAAFRVNVMAHDSNVADRDVTENTRTGIAPALALGLGTPTRLAITYLHQSEYDIPDYGVPILYPATPAGHGASAGPVSLSQIDRSTFYGFKNGDYLRTNVDVPTIKLEHDFNADLTVRDELRYGYYQRQFRITEAQTGDAPGAATLAFGQIAAGTQLGNIVVFRNELSAYSTETSLDNQADATYRFKTGGFDHTMVGGFELGRETSDPVRNTTNQPYSTTSLLAPNFNQPYNASTYVASRTDVMAYSWSVFALDTVKLNENWQVMAGLRDDEVNSAVSVINFRNPDLPAVAPAANFIGGKDDNMPSWRAALIYKPVINGTIYVDGGTSFDPQIEQLSLAANAAALSPVKNISYEVGTKWELFDGRLATQTSVFRTEQLNVKETDPNNAAQMILAGDALAEGGEMQVIGRITKEWQVSAGYAFTYSVIDKSPTPGAGSDLGHRLGNVPMHTFNLWTGYEFANKLEIGGGVNYVSDRYTGSTPSAVGGAFYWKDVPGYWVANAMVKYPVMPGTSVQLNFYNLTDAKYYDQLHPSHVVPGAGPSALLTVTYKY